MNMKGRSLRSGDMSKRSKKSSNDIVGTRRESGRDTSTNNVARLQKKKNSDGSKTGRKPGGLLTMPRSNPTEDRDCGTDGEEDVLVDSSRDNRKRRHEGTKDASSDEDSSSSEDIDEEDDDEDGENISDEAERATSEKENIPVIAATDGRGTRQRVVGT